MVAGEWGEKKKHDGFPCRKRGREEERPLERERKAAATKGGGKVLSPILDRVRGGRGGRERKTRVRKGGKSTIFSGRGGKTVAQGEGKRKTAL